MGAVMQGTVYDEKNQAYTISLENDSYVDQVAPLTLRDFKIQYEGGEHIYSPIVSSSAKFVISVPNSNIADTLTGITQAAEGDYYIKVLKGSNLYWIGLVVMDLAVVAYDSMPFDFTLTAVDGLARLKALDFDDTTARTTFHDILISILERIPYASAYSSTDLFLKAQCQWWDTSQTGAYVYNAWEYARINTKVFKKVEDNGEASYTSCYKVLEEICTNWFCRIMQSDGVFWLWQIPRYQHTGIIQIKQYSKDGTLQSNSLVNNFSGVWSTDLGTSAERLAANADGTMRTGAIERYLPALRTVKVRYDHNGTTSLFTGISWEGFGTAASYTDGPVDDNAGEATLLFDLGINYNAAFDTGTSAYSLRALINATIYIEDGTGTKYYLRRSASLTGMTPVYQNAYWSTTSGVFQLYTNVKNPSQSAPVYTNFVYISPILPVSGDLTISFAYSDTHSSNGESQLPDLESFDLAINSCELLLDGNPNHQVNYRLATATNTTANNSEVLEITTLIGDGPTIFSLGAIEVENPLSTGTWVLSTDWNYLGQTTYYDRSQLLAHEILAMQNEATYQLDGVMITDGDFAAHRLVIDGGRRMMMMSGTFDVIRAEWDLLLVQISYDDSNITTPTPGETFNTPGGVRQVRSNRGGLIDPLQGGGSNLADVISQRQSVQSTTSVFETGDTIGNFNLEDDTGQNFYVGDGITLYNVATGEYQDFEVDFQHEDYNAFNVVDVTATADFPAGSLVSASYASLLRIITQARFKYVTIMLYDSTETVSGTVTEFPEFFRVPNYMNGYFLAGYYLAHHTPGVRPNLANDYHFRLTHDNGTTTKELDIEVDFNKTSVLYDFSTDSDPYIVLATNDLITFSIEAWDNTTGTPPDGLTITLKIVATI